MNNPSQIYCMIKGCTTDNPCERCQLMIDAEAAWVVRHCECGPNCVITGDRYCAG